MIKINISRHNDEYHIEADYPEETYDTQLVLLMLNALELAIDKHDQLQDLGIGLEVADE